MISLKETAQILGIGEYTLKRWVDEKKIKCIYVEENIFFKQKDVDEFIEKTGIKLVKPQSYTEALDMLHIEMSIKNNTLSDEKIKKLIENMNN